MSLDLINPFEEIVVIGKRYKVAVPPQSSTVIRALVPTGRHVSHANKLGHWSGPHTGGKATRLERYTGGHGGKKKGIHVGKSLAGGLEMLGRTPKVSKVPPAPKNNTPRSSFGGELRRGLAGRTDVPYAKKPSMFSLSTTSGKTIAGGTAATAGLSAYALGKDKEKASKALGAAALPVKAPLKAVKPTTPMAPKTPLPVKATTSTLNSKMPAAASHGSRLL